MTAKKRTAGGAAMGGGGDFQARAFAWAAAHMLGENDVTPPFALTEPVTAIGCEGVDAIDDILVSAGPHGAFIQAKTTVSIPGKSRHATVKIPFVSAFDQFVRQFLDRRAAVSAGSSVPYDATHDRFVLAVSSHAPATVRNTLKLVLDRVRRQ